MSNPTTNGAKSGTAGGGRGAGGSSTTHAATPVAGFSSPVYRGPLSHGTAAELQEGFRILSKGQRVAAIGGKDLHAVMQTAGMHVTEEELQELLRVVHQDDRGVELDFSEFMLLMTKEVDETMLEELKTAFHAFDKNRTGMISRKQFTEMFVSLGEHSANEELEELLAIADNSDNTEMVDYNKFVSELVMRLNTM